jgi:hypothetical protein
MKAEQANLMEDKLSWLCMAQTWLGMIPEAQPTAADGIQTTVRDRGTGQAKIFDVTLLLKGVLAGHGDAGERQNV